MEDIITAIIENDFDLFVSLINRNGYDSIDEDGFTVLMYCIQEDRFAMIDFLLTKDIEINKTNAVGNTALFYAVFNSKNKTEVIEKLLKKGADMTIVNKSGVSPLSLANTMANVNVKNFMNTWYHQKVYKNLS